MAAWSRPSAASPTRTRAWRPPHRWTAWPAPAEGTQRITVHQSRHARARLKSRRSMLCTTPRRSRARSMGLCPVAREAQSGNKGAARAARGERGRAYRARHVTGGKRAHGTDIRLAESDDAAREHGGWWTVESGAAATIGALPTMSAGLPLARGVRAVAVLTMPGDGVPRQFGPLHGLRRSHFTAGDIQLSRVPLCLMTATSRKPISRHLNSQL